MGKEKFAIPVLMYHHVNPVGNFVNVTPQRFESHMDYLSRHGFTTLDTREFMDILNSQKKPPEKPVVITFDDGWLDNWLFAFPVLKKYGFKAVIFVITGLVPEKGRRRRADEGAFAGLPPHDECRKMAEEGEAADVMISWEEIGEMVNSGLVDIQSHTHTHIRYDRLYSDHRERMDIIRYELKISKETIQEKLRRQCIAICWPFGIYDESYVEAAKSAGYSLMFTTQKGTNTRLTEPWRIRRITIGNIGVGTLRKKLFIHMNSCLSHFYLSLFGKRKIF
jgi:peptidoglycan/xylan/chitin deacetylase (PgdA/CDA1 family)